MTKKQIIYSIIAFICAFLITLIIKFPLNTVASNIISNMVTKQKIDIRYDTINVTFFGSTATNVKTGPLVIKNVELDYNPIGLLFKRVGFKVDSTAFVLEGSLKGNKINADVKASVAGLAQIGKMTGSGTVNGSLFYNIKDEKGKIELDAPKKVSFNHPLMPVTVDSLKGLAEIDKNKLSITKLEATGDNSLNITGFVDLNKKRIDTSILNLDGEVSMGNFPLKFSLTGPAKKPSFSIKNNS